MPKKTKGTLLDVLDETDKRLEAVEKKMKKTIVKEAVKKYKNQRNCAILISVILGIFTYNYFTWSDFIREIQTPIIILKTSGDIREPEKEETRSQEDGAAVSSSLIMEGEASYYSREGCLGCHPRLIMANGEPLVDEAKTLAVPAHMSYMVGHKVVVENAANGKKVVAKVTDTGGFYKAKYNWRVADLTVSTRDALGCGDTCQVKIYEPNA